MGSGSGPLGHRPAAGHVIHFRPGDAHDDGLSPADVVAAAEPLGLAALGANCGRSLDHTAQLVSEFLEAGLSSPLWVKPNAGVPKVVAAGVVYPEDPDSFALRLAEFAGRGAQIVGGCCGSTPAHLAALARLLGRDPSSRIDDHAER